MIGKLTNPGLRGALYGLSGLILVGLIAYMVVDRAGILRIGTEVTLQTRPVDPRDFLRGDYVVLNYEIASLQAGALKDKPASGRHAPVYVKLVQAPDGFHKAVSVHDEPVIIGPTEVLIRGRVVSGTYCGRESRAFCDNLTVRYGIEKYFVPEGEGRQIEHSRNEGKVSVVAAVTPGGRAAIKRLLIDGQPVYDEPSF